VAESTFGGIKPLARGALSEPGWLLATLNVDGTAIATSPGKITSSGKNILGIAAIKGVRRAEAIESAAMARCTTRKSVHQ
jgi:hypothetical protein